MVFFNLPLGWYLDLPTPARVLPGSWMPIWYSDPVRHPYTGIYGGGTFAISYLSSLTTAPSYTNNILQYNWAPRWVDSQPGLPDGWDAPFIYEDRRYLFYVTTTEILLPIGSFNGFGALPASTPARAISPLVLRQPVTTQAATQRYVFGKANINAALGSSTAIFYQRQMISPFGNLSILNSGAHGDGGEE
jgi:hypothetical protein